MKFSVYSVLNTFPFWLQGNLFKYKLVVGLVVPFLIFPLNTKGFRLFNQTTRVVC